MNLPIPYKRALKESEKTEKLVTEIQHKNVSKNGFSKEDGELYSPKPIVAYANYHATGEEPTNDFSGGLDTPCIKAFERLGIPIFKKTKSMSSNGELYKLREDFLKQWLIDRLKT